MADIIPGEIWHRDDFGMLCEWRMLYRCVEVGVDRGAFAEIFLRRCYNYSIYLAIDPYLPYHEMLFDREADYLTAVAKLWSFRNAKIIRLNSSQAIETLSRSESSLWLPPYDFVYLDADHHEDEVYQQCCAWWELISEGGILAGHDWDLGASPDHKGVKLAVIRFAEERNLTIRYTYHDCPQSWYINKGTPRSERNLLGVQSGT